MDVDVFVHDYNAFGEHGLSQAPDGVHHFARLHRVGLADRQNHQVVEDPLGWHRHVADLGNLHSHQRQEDPLNRFPHVEVFHRRRTDDRRRVNWILAMGYAFDMEDRIIVRQRIEARVIAKRAFASQFTRSDVALQHELGIGRNFHVVGLALDHFDGLRAQESGDHHFIEIWRQRQNRRIHRRRIAPDRHGDRHTRDLSLSLQAPVVLGALLVRLPVHASRALIVDLHAITAAVALACLRILGENHRQSNEGPAVFGPAVQHRDFLEVNVLADHVLAWPA